MLAAVALPKKFISNTEAALISLVKKGQKSVVAQRQCFLHTK